MRKWKAYFLNNQCCKFLFSFFVILIFLCGCSKADVVQDTLQSNTMKLDKCKIMQYVDASELTYQMITESYEEDTEFRHITISYPQLTAMKDTKKQTEINRLISSAAQSQKDRFGDGTDGPFIPELSNAANVTITINYGIQSMNDKLISIRFHGIGMAKGSAHPTNLLYTVNIDIEESKIIYMEDLFHVSLFEQFDRRIFRYKYDEVYNEEGTISQAVQDTSDKELLQAFQQHAKYCHTDQPVYDDFYLLPDRIVLILPVSHSIGDYLEFEVHYTDIIASWMK